MKFTIAIKLEGKTLYITLQYDVFTLKIVPVLLVNDF
jgi:hypothetical protein